MKTHSALKMLVMAIAVALPLQIVSAADDTKQRPHVIRLGAGYSLVPGADIDGGKMVLGSLKHGAGINVGYDYLFLNKSWSLGLNYNLHYGSGTGRTYDGFGSSAMIDFFVHNITPTVGNYQTWGKHRLKTDLGIGYLYVQALGAHKLGDPTERLRAIEEGMSTYFAIEYEYSPSSDTGLFVRLHEVNCFKKDGAQLEGLLNYGMSVGFNLHF